MSKIYDDEKSIDEEVIEKMNSLFSSLENKSVGEKSKLLILTKIFERIKKTEDDLGKLTNISKNTKMNEKIRSIYSSINYGHEKLKIAFEDKSKIIDLTLKKTLAEESNDESPILMGAMDYILKLIDALTNEMEIINYLEDLLTLEISEEVKNILTTIIKNTRETLVKLLAAIKDYITDLLPAKKNNTLGGMLFKKY